MASFVEFAINALFQRSISESVDFCANCGRFILLFPLLKSFGAHMTSNPIAISALAEQRMMMGVRRMWPWSLMILD